LGSGWILKNSNLYFPPLSQPQTSNFQILVSTFNIQFVMTFHFGLSTHAIQGQHVFQMKHENLA
jgi:hypothetical protein